MRLIDADKLKISYDGHFVGVAKNDLDNAPTVEAQPIIHAHWEDFSAVCDGAVCCSNCHIGTIKTYDFCPHCGAVMDEEVNNDA